MDEPPQSILADGLTHVLGALDEVTDDPAERILTLVYALACEAAENRCSDQTWDELAEGLGKAIKIAVEEVRPLAESLQPYG